MADRTRIDADRHLSARKAETNCRPFSKTALPLLVGVACLVVPLEGSHAGVLPSVGGYLGKSEAEISESLQSHGYELEEFEADDGKIEVEAEVDGVSYEIHIDRETGKIVHIEKDD